MKANTVQILIITLSLTIFSYGGFKYYAQTVKNHHGLVTDISSRMFDFNTFELTTASALNSNDFKIIQQKNGKTVFEQGKSKKGVINDYGHRRFDLLYKDVKIYEMSHFSENSWQTYDYRLDISIRDNAIIVQSHQQGVEIFFKKFE